MEARDIARIFEQRIRAVFIGKTDLINFFLKHERRNICEKNLRLEIFNAELKFGPKMDSVRAAKLIKAGADLFARAAINHLEFKNMSAAQKQIEASKNKKMADLEDWYAKENKEALSTSTSLSMFHGNKKTEEAEIKKEEGATPQERKA